MPETARAEPLPTATGGGGRPHVVVVGAGFGGLAAVHGLRNADVEVTQLNGIQENLQFRLPAELRTPAPVTADAAA